MKIAISSDEQVPLTDHVIHWLKQQGHEVVLCGSLKGKIESWPRAAQELAELVATGEYEQGVLFCYTGTGASIAANKVPGIRAALCVDAATAIGARRWNHANVLTMAYRNTTETVADEILEAWFAAPLGVDEEQDAVEQVAEIERKYTKPLGVDEEQDAVEQVAEIERKYTKQSF